VAAGKARSTVPTACQHWAAKAGTGPGQPRTNDTPAHEEDAGHHSTGAARAGFHLEVAAGAAGFQRAPAACPGTGGVVRTILIWRSP